MVMFQCRRSFGFQPGERLSFRRQTNVSAVWREVRPCEGKLCACERLNWRGDDWMHSHIFSLITSLCVSAPHLQLSVVVTLPRQEWPCVEAHTINLRDVLITPLCLLRLPETNAEISMLCSPLSDRSSLTCLSVWFTRTAEQYCQSLCRPRWRPAFEKHNRGDYFVFLFPLKRVLLFSVFICTVDTQPAPPCPVCHPVPRGLLWHVAPTLPSCTTRLTSHSHKPILVGSWSWRGYKRKRERERERERERRHTNTPPLSDTHTHTHTSLPQCSDESSGSLVNFFPWLTGSSRPVSWQIESPRIHYKSAAMGPLQLC